MRIFSLIVGFEPTPDFPSAISLAMRPLNHLGISTDFPRLLLRSGVFHRKRLDVFVRIKIIP